MVVVGPDTYLAEGITDRLKERNIPVFGPTKLAAEIEWSKSFAKQLMREEGIPTARFGTFTNFDDALGYLKTQEFPVVVKASGLALGKGVIIAEDFSGAEDALRKLMREGVHGDAGSEVVVEEYLHGREISIHAFCDGETAVLFPASQDHKRIFDNDKGPNTGGMGTIAPVPWVTEKDLLEIKEKIVLPTLHALKKRGRTFRGVLFPGVMMTTEGPKVIEFNARFGDPETQSYMQILDSDLVDILTACIHGELNKINIQWSKKFACCVVCVSEGYPGSYQKGKHIVGLEGVEKKRALVFHAGTKVMNDTTVTDGGRVLGVAAVGDSLPKALSKVYSALESVSFEGMYFRKDIGQKSLP